MWPTIEFLLLLKKINCFCDVIKIVSQTIKQPMQCVQVNQPGYSCPLSLVPFGDDVVVPSSEKSRQVFHGSQCRTLFQFLTILYSRLYFGTKLVYA